MTELQGAHVSDRRDRQPVHEVTTADGAGLAVRRIGARRRGPPVILTHGMFSNQSICVPLARYLAREGFECWVYDWRGHGQSTSGGTPPTFDRLAALDVPAMISFVRERTACERVAWVAHSGGGLALLMHLARVPEAAARISCGVFFGSQAVGAATTPLGKAFVALTGAIHALYARVHGPRLHATARDEFVGILGPWLRWNRTGRWTGEDGFDYEAALSKLEVSVLAFAGTGDRWIAPPEGCARLVRALGGTRKELVVCAPRNGFGEDYGHAGIILSRGARKEIWPRVAGFLRANGAG
jgi:oxygen-independent coproporphyrinogen-3 oxidase